MISKHLEVMTVKQRDHRAEEEPLTPQNPHRHRLRQKINGPVDSTNVSVSMSKRTLRASSFHPFSLYSL